MLVVDVMLVLMIIGAIVAIEVKDLLSSVVAVGAVGLGLAVVCLLLKAPDVAITQLIVEIMTVIILIRATLRTDLPGSTTRSTLPGAAVAVAFAAVVAVYAAGALRELPPFGNPTMRVAQTYVNGGAGPTGATNLVTAILLDYRAYDTLGEATVLFTAVLGVLAVVRARGRRSDKERNA